MTRFIAAHITFFLPDPFGRWFVTILHNLRANIAPVGTSCLPSWDYSCKVHCGVIPLIPLVTFLPRGLICTLLASEKFQVDLTFIPSRQSAQHSFYIQITQSPLAVISCQCANTLFTVVHFSPKFIGCSVHKDLYPVIAQYGS